jgi:long-chain-fatty-acid--CoA ligase ACSBG
VVYAPEFLGGHDKLRDGDVSVLSWKEFLALESATTDAELDELQANMVPNDCLSLIYTSGTTGNAKAVMVSHDNVVCEAVSFVQRVPSFGEAGQERVLSFLPLSHIAGALLDVYIPIYTTAKRPGYFTTYFARPYDLKAGLLG